MKKISIIVILLSSAVYAEQLNIIVPVPSDAGATYTILDRVKQKGNQVTVTTRREGSSGSSYSKRLVDCNTNQFRYLADADSYEEMKKQNKTGSLSPLVAGSISWYIAQYACLGN